jgi:hypothetical protein
MIKTVLSLLIVISLLSACSQEQTRSCPTRKGIVTLKYKSGKTKAKFFVENCVYNGPYYAFYPNGRSRCRGKFLNGKKFSNWKYRNINGKLRARYDYDSSGTAYSIERHGKYNTVTIVQSTAPNKPFLFIAPNGRILTPDIKDSEWKTLDLNYAERYFILSSKHEFCVFDEGLNERFNIRSYRNVYDRYTSSRSTYEIRKGTLQINTRHYDKRTKAWKENEFDFAL